MSERKLSEEENALRFKLYRKGYNDSEIANVVGITPRGIYLWRKRNNLNANESRGGKPRVINLNPSWELGYFIGIVLGDGTINKSGRAYTVRVVSTKKEYIELIEGIVKKLFHNIKPTICSFNATNKLPISGKVVKSRCYSISLCSKQLYNFIKQYKPKKFTWIPPADQPDIVKYGFLGGIIDSDGVISRSSISVISKYKENLIALKEFIKNLGFIYGKISIYERHRDGNKQYQISIFGRENHRIILEKCKLPFKRNALLKYLNIEYNRERTAHEYNEAMKLKENFTPKEISNKLGININTLYSWFYNNNKPRCIKLADKYGKE